MFGLRARLSWAAVLAAGGLLALGAPGPARAQNGVAVDLALVLAVDASSSVSVDEFDLQMRGLAGAFRDPEVIGAIRATGDLGIAVTLVQWSDNRKQFVAVDWMAVRDEASAEALAVEIDKTPRFVIGGGTAIGGALQFSIARFEASPFEARRKVIDLSGDGRTNQGQDPSRLRDLAVAAGITINGLAILNEDQTVDLHYRSSVIGGTGAFVMTTSDYRDFARAMRIKLIKEISDVPVAGPPPGPGLAAALPD